MFGLCLLWQDPFLYNTFLQSNIFSFFSVPGDQCASYKTRLHNASSMCELRGKPLYATSYSLLKPVLAFFSLCCMWLIFFNLLQVKKCSPVFSMSASGTELDCPQPDAFGPYTGPIWLWASPARWGFYCWLFPLSLNYMFLAQPLSQKEWKSSSTAFSPPPPALPSALQDLQPSWYSGFTAIPDRLC